MSYIKDKKELVTFQAARHAVGDTVTDNALTTQEVRALVKGTFSTAKADASIEVVAALTADSRAVYPLTERQKEEYEAAITRRRIRAAQFPEPDTIERILLSTATALDATHYWYVEGDNVETAVSRYSGKRDHDYGEFKRLLDNHPSNHAFPGVPLLPSSKRPESHTIVVPVEAEGKVKGFAVFLRNDYRAPLQLEGKFIDEERELARFMVQSQAEFIAPPTKGYGATLKDAYRDIAHPTQQKEALWKKQLAFLQGLDERAFKVLTKRAEEYAPHTPKKTTPTDQTGHVKRVGELYYDFMQELSTSPLDKPIKLDLRMKPQPEDLPAYYYAARLHDFDKIQIAPGILYYPKKPEDFMKYRLDMHPWQSRDVVDVPILDHMRVDIRTIIGNHHMDMNGMGYPNNVLNNPFSTEIDHNLSFGSTPQEKKARSERKNAEGQEKEASNIGNEMGDVWIEPCGKETIIRGNEKDPHANRIIVKRLDPGAAALALIDRFEAITGERCYQDPKRDPLQHVMKILYKETCGGAIDPEMFVAFINSKTFNHYIDHQRHLMHNEADKAGVRTLVASYNDQLKYLSDANAKSDDLPPLAVAILHHRAGQVAYTAVTAPDLVGPKPPAHPPLRP